MACVYLSLCFSGSLNSSLQFISVDRAQIQLDHVSVLLLDYFIYFVNSALSLSNS